MVKRARYNSSVIDANSLLPGSDFDDLPETYVIFITENDVLGGDKPLGKLMHDFSCKNPSDMYYKILADSTRYYKEDEKGVNAMCKIMEELIDGEKRESALRLLKIGKLSNEEIAIGLGLDVEVVNALQNEL